MKKVGRAIRFIPLLQIGDLGADYEEKIIEYFERPKNRLGACLSSLENYGWLQREDPLRNLLGDTFIG